MNKKLHCPICREPARVASVTLAPTVGTILVAIECMVCADHIGTVVELPTSEHGSYELPEIGSNIYNPLKSYLNKK